MKKILLVLTAAFIYLAWAPTPVLAIGGNEYVMASQTDESFFCPTDWETCFTNGAGQISIPLGKGSALGGGTLLSVTIAKDENSQYKDGQWLTGFECFTDAAYTTHCPDWIYPDNYNGHQTYIIDEAATSTSDSKHWTSYYTNFIDWQNYDYSFPIKFNPNYYYRLIINDNGWNIGAYGSQSLNEPYFVIRGIKTAPDPVIIIPGILGSWEKNGQWILDPILHTYDNLIDTLLANGYVKDQTLFTFPYDWEQPNEVTATQLKNKIADIKATCGCSKVDLIGHSMGGLVAAQYIESDNYQNDVDQLFLVATPLSGAPKAYRVWEGGVIDFGDSSQNTLMTIMFNLEAYKNGFNNIFDYIHNKPLVSVQELLPVQIDYLKIGNTFLHFPSGYPQNGFLQNLLQNFSRIAARGVTLKTILADTKDNSTIGGFVIASSTKIGLWADGEPTATILVAGDGTVPRSSIENVTTVDKEYDFQTHLSIPSTSAPYIFTQLTGKSPDIIVGNTYNVFKSVLFFKLFSPIDMVITAPDGKKLGKDFSSNTEINQIPDGFYSGFIGDNEYAVIPNPLPGQYKVDTIGTGNGGHYTIVADYADTSTTSSVVVTGTSTPAAIEAHTFIVSATSTTISLPFPPAPPAATSTPTTTQITPDTCVSDLAAAYKNKWITKKAVFDTLTLDCKVLKGLFATRDNLQKIAASKQKPAEKLLLALTQAGIKLVLADMDLLAKDKGNTKDGVLLITKYTTWFRNH